VVVVDLVMIFFEFSHRVVSTSSCISGEHTATIFRLAELVWWLFSSDTGDIQDKQISPLFPPKRTHYMV